MVINGFVMDRRKEGRKEEEEEEDEDKGRKG